MPGNASPAAAVVVRHNLPAEVSSFVGRGRELAVVAQLLAASRLLTLVGMGGCGKTRLAVRAAADLAPGFPDGVWLVDLASLADPSLLPHAVASVLGTHEEPARPLAETLAAHLAPQRLLLVLDNCEHLAEACALLCETLLRAGPQLRILATSREPLRADGEMVWRVPALELPEPDGPRAPADLARVEAVALFLDRARARQPDFALTAHTAPPVAEVCRRLDGLPLAIELAAARVGALTVAQIAARLDDALAMLAGGRRTLPRHQTLRAALDWSHALLTPSEQAVFRRLAAFAGSFDLPAAQAVGGADERRPTQADGTQAAPPVGRPPPLLDRLTQLVDKSLVVAQPAGAETRYRLLEPVRQYAAQRLADSGEADEIQRRHAEHYLALAETAEPKLMSGERGPWLARLETELDNLRAALSWGRRAADAGDTTAAELALRLVGALEWFWYFYGQLVEGRAWAEAALASGDSASATARARALQTAGVLAWLLDDHAAARQRLEECAALQRSLDDERDLAYTLTLLGYLAKPDGGRPATPSPSEEGAALFRELGDRWGLAIANFALGAQAYERADYPAARPLLAESVALLRDLGDLWFCARVLNVLGDLARSQGENAQAMGLYQESLALFRAQGLKLGTPSVLHNLGYMALRQGDADQAQRLFQEALGLYQELGDQRGVAECLAGLGGVFGARRQAERAARLFGAAEALLAASGAALWPSNRDDYQGNLTAARAQLDERAFQAAWAEGRKLSPEQAVQAVSSAAEHGPGAERAGRRVAAEDGSPSKWSPLTPREQEVAALVARGLTNRQIAERLVIAEGTAGLHVKHILAKLGFESRAQIAAWAVEHGAVSQVDGPAGLAV